MHRNLETEQSDTQRPNTITTRTLRQTLKHRTQSQQCKEYQSGTFHGTRYIHQFALMRCEIPKNVG